MPQQSFGGASALSHSPGVLSWSSPNNVLTNDGDFSNVTMNSGDTSEVLSVSCEGFTIPPAATVNGIEVNVLREENGPTGTGVNRAYLTVTVNGVTSGVKTNSTEWDTTPTYHGEGSPTDNWGLTLTPAGINVQGVIANFSTEIPGIGSGEARVYYLDVTVFYTDAAGTPASQTLRGLLGGGGKIVTRSALGGL